MSPKIWDCVHHGHTTCTSKAFEQQAAQQCQFSISHMCVAVKSPSILCDGMVCGTCGVCDVHTHCYRYMLTAWRAPNFQFGFQHSSQSRQNTQSYWKHVFSALFELKEKYLFLWNLNCKDFSCLCKNVSRFNSHQQNYLNSHNILVETDFSSNLAQVFLSFLGQFLAPSILSPCDLCDKRFNWNEYYFEIELIAWTRRHVFSCLSRNIKKWHLVHERRIDNGIDFVIRWLLCVINQISCSHGICCWCRWDGDKDTVMIEFIVWISWNQSSNPKLNLISWLRLQSNRFVSECHLLLASTTFNVFLELIRFYLLSYSLQGRMIQLCAKCRLMLSEFHLMRFDCEQCIHYIASKEKTIQVSVPASYSINFTFACIVTSASISTPQNHKYSIELNRLHAKNISNRVNFISAY